MSITVSILMPMRNAEAYINDAIQSLLAQSFSDFEIIVVNDGSNDNSQALVESFSDLRIKLFQGGCRGISAALNLALNHAQGEYICRCDADDLYPEDRLQSQINWLNENPDYIAVTGKFSSMDEKGHVITEFETGDEACDLTTELLAAQTRTHLGTFLMRQDVLTRLKGFREYFVTAEDLDMQFRLAEQGRIGYVPENMYFYRIHDSSITHVRSLNKIRFFGRMARDFLKQRLEEGQDLLQKGKPPAPPLFENESIDSVEQIVGYMIGQSWRLHGEKKRYAALVISIRACIKKPFYWPVWKNIFMILVKR